MPQPVVPNLQPNADVPNRRQRWLGLAILILPFLMHAVGAVGLLLPEWRALFLLLTPWQLVGMAALVLGLHPQLSVPFGLWAAAAFLLGMAFEMLGVHTGAVFGEYGYGPVLGPQVLGVPWVIGLNWAVLAYGCGALAQRWLRAAWGWVPLAAGLMVGLDVLIEPVAIALGFWHWGGGLPPLQNYIGWAGVALLIQLAAAGLGIRYESRAALPVILAMLGFFAVLGIGLS